MCLLFLLVRYITKEQQHSQEIDRLKEEFLKEREGIEAEHSENIDNVTHALENKYKEEIGKLLKELQEGRGREEEEQRSTEAREDFNREIRELKLQHEKELEDARGEMEEAKMKEMAKLSIKLSMKNAQSLEKQRQEMKKKHEGNMEEFRVESQKDYERTALRLSSEIESMELKHRKVGGVSGLSQSLARSYKAVRGFT